MKVYSEMKMKCRGKTTTSSLSSLPTSVITHLCPISWLSKFKQKVGNLEASTNPAKKKQRSKLDFPTLNSSLPECWREARFYSVDDDDDDAYWRLSFSHCRRSACGDDTLWSESDDEFQVPFSSFKSLSKVPRRGENQNFNEMISDKKVKETQHKKSILQVTKDVKERRSRKPRSRVVRKKEDGRILEDEECKVKRGKGEFQARKMRQKQARAYSSKTEFRVRVVEDMKKAKTKMKKTKKTEEQEMRSRTVFDSFAMVKNSFNPQQDFRDSMVEMIREKGIRWREELEELLAAYLTLNCDEYHDLIIKVFQQVWFDLNRCM